MSSFPLTFIFFSEGVETTNQLINGFTLFTSLIYNGCSILTSMAIDYLLNMVIFPSDLRGHHVGDICQGGSMASLASPSPGSPEVRLVKEWEKNACNRRKHGLPSGKLT